MRKGQNPKNYNLDENEDLKKAIRYKKYILTIFFLTITAPFIIIYGIDIQNISQTVRNTVVESINSKDLENKLKYNTTDKSLIIITRNDDEITHLIFNYILLYFKKLNNGGFIYYYDDSSEYNEFLSSDANQNFLQMQNQLHYEHPITFYVVDKTEVSQNYSLNTTSEELQDIDSLNKKIYIKRKIMLIYLYFDRIYNVSISKTLEDKLTKEVLQIHLNKINKEKAFSDKDIIQENPYLTHQR